METPTIMITVKVVLFVLAEPDKATGVVVDEGSTDSVCVTVGFADGTAVGVATVVAWAVEVLEVVDV